MPITLAYKYVATAVILMQINHYASRMHLPISLPITEEDIRKQSMSPPEVLGVTGGIDTDRYFFSVAGKPKYRGGPNWSTSGRLMFVINTAHPYYALKSGSEEKNDYFRGLTNEKANITKDSAYQMATNWLSGLDVDVQRLNQEHSSSVEQWKWQERFPMPLFEVKWMKDWDFGNGRIMNMPLISVLIDGRSGELVHLRQEDDSYSLQPSRLINNLDKLLAITDDQFLKFTPELRSKLVMEFAVAQPWATRPATETAGQGSPAHPATTDHSAQQ